MFLIWITNIAHLGSVEISGTHLKPAPQRKCVFNEKVALKETLHKKLLFCGIHYYSSSQRSKHFAFAAVESQENNLPPRKLVSIPYMADNMLWWGSISGVNRHPHSPIGLPPTRQLLLFFPFFFKIQNKIIGMTFLFLFCTFSSPLQTWYRRMAGGGEDIYSQESLFFFVAEASKLERKKSFFSHVLLLFVFRRRFKFDASLPTFISPVASAG